MKVDLLQDIIIEGDESDELLSRLESSFGIDSTEMGLSNGMTLHELVQCVLTKLDRRTSDGCTSQSLFYKVRGMLVSELGISKSTISPTSKLSGLLPKASRRQTIARLEKGLGIKIRYYQAPGWIQLGALLTLLLSFIWLFINPGFGIIGIVISLLIISIAHKVSSSLPFQTFGELIERIWTDNLVQIQNNEGSINPREVDRVLINVICDLHGIEKEEIDFRQRLVFA